MRLSFTTLMLFALLSGTALQSLSAASPPDVRRRLCLAETDVLFPGFAPRSGCLQPAGHSPRRASGGEAAANLDRNAGPAKPLTFSMLTRGVVAQTLRQPVKESNPNAWKDFTSAEGRFTVSLPGRPAHRDSTLDTRIGKITTHFFELDTDMAYYYVSYADFPSVGPLTPEQNKEMLDSTRDQALGGDNSLISEREVSIGETIGRELLVSKGDMILKSRHVYVEGRLYQLIFAVRAIVAFRNGKPSPNAKDRTDLFEKTSTTFFDSFKLKK